MKPATTVAEARERLAILRATRDSRHCQQVLRRLADHSCAIKVTEIYDGFTRVSSYPIERIESVFVDSERVA